MIWRDDDKHDEQQKKLEYARELEQQIDLRKALEREERQQQEDWERRFVRPRDAQSPAKWWTDLRSSEPPTARLGFQMDASALPAYSSGIEVGAPTLGSVTPGGRRFHATFGDPLAPHDRLREKAQQLEWRRLLDEQLREKERRKQQEELEKQLRERAEAQEEMRFLREQQLRAQRKLGIQDFSPHPYLPIPSPPAPTKQPSDVEPEDANAYEGYAEPALLPPPAPVHVRPNDSVDFNFRRAMGLSEAPHTETPRDRMVDEYRALLIEIRHEREELRREREELRREKEELRMERALMQMENEKMATLLESQRHMTDQRLENMARYEAPSPSPPRFERRPPPTQLPSPLHIVHRDHTVPQHLPNPVHARLGAMSLADFAPASTPLRSPSTRALDAVHARRHERFRLHENNPLERSLNGESEFIALSPRARGDQRRRRSSVPAPRIMETRSPSASMMDPQRARANPLRNSRVIKSRGFYDFIRDDAQPPRIQRRTRDDDDVPTHRETTSAVEDSDSDDNEQDYRGQGPTGSDDDEEEGDDNDDGYQDDDDDDLNTGSELSRSLFQVQVLTHESS